jgi:hypothetical protein
MRGRRRRGGGGRGSEGEFVHFDSFVRFHSLNEDRNRTEQRN